MDFLQSHELSQLGLWSPIIGGILIYIGLNIKVSEVNSNEQVMYNLIIDYWINKFHARKVN